MMYDFVSAAMRKEVGRAIRESGIPRNEIFVVTKVSRMW